MTKLLRNDIARLAFMERQGLSASPNRLLTKEGLLQLIQDIGFVQVDSIQTVERAHHQILFSRNQTYRREHLTALLEKDRLLFEHWTHDAAILPSAFYPYWKHRFRRKEQDLLERWRRWRGEGLDAAFAETYERIAKGGPITSREVKNDDHVSGGWWNWHPNKAALEYFWHTGRFAIAGRSNFQKIYDLAERVIPAQFFEPEVSHEDFIDWACRSALRRLGFATHGEIAAFWALITPIEAKAWIDAHRAELEEVLVESAGNDKPRAAFAFSGFTEKVFDVAFPPARIRVLSPFDPMIRDRARTERLFGFFYRIEVFVPEPKRQYGYYVFPLLEGDRFIGRIDMKADRKADALVVRRLWLEAGVKASAGRMQRLEAELERLARFTGVRSVAYATDWRD